MIQFKVFLLVHRFIILCLVIQYFLKINLVKFKFSMIICNLKNLRTMNHFQNINRNFTNYFILFKVVKIKEYLMYLNMNKKIIINILLKMFYFLLKFYKNYTKLYNPFKKLKSFNFQINNFKFTIISENRMITKLYYC